MHIMIKDDTVSYSLVLPAKYSYAFFFCSCFEEHSEQSMGCEFFSSLTFILKFVKQNNSVQYHIIPFAWSSPTK